MPAPHEDAKYWQADEIAECLAVTDETYAEIWNKIVPLYDREPVGYPKLHPALRDEAPYPIADYWDKLSDAAQADINGAFHQNIIDEDEVNRRYAEAVPHG